MLRGAPRRAKTGDEVSERASTAGKGAGTGPQAAAARRLRGIVVLFSAVVWALAVSASAGALALVGLGAVVMQLVLSAAARADGLPLGPGTRPDLAARADALAASLGLAARPVVWLCARRPHGARGWEPAGALHADELARCAGDAPATDFLIARALCAPSAPRWLALAWPAFALPGLGASFRRAVALAADERAASVCRSEGDAARALMRVDLGVGGQGGEDESDVDAALARARDASTSGSTIGAWLRSEPSLAARIAAVEGQPPPRRTATASAAAIGLGLLAFLCAAVLGTSTPEPPGQRSGAGVEEVGPGGADEEVEVAELDGEGDAPPRRRAASDDLATAYDALELLREAGLEASPTEASPSEPSPLERALDEELAPVFDHPEFVRRAEGLDASQQRTLAGALVAYGQFRLPDEALATRTVLMGRVLAIADAPTCAAIMRGEASGAAERAQLGEADARSWARLSARAAMLELEQAPTPPPPEPAAIQSAMGRLFGALGEPDGARLASGLSNLEALDDDEACWVARTLYGGIAGAEGDDRGTLARALVR